MDGATNMTSHASESSSDNDDQHHSSVARCGCFSPDQEHHQSFVTFQSQINNSLKNLQPQRTQYDKVRALIVYWEDGEPDMSTDANELGNLLKDGYGFEVESHVIKNGDGQDNPTIYQEFYFQLTLTIRAIAEKDRNNLLIPYYAGHGAQKDKRNDPLRKVWAPRPKSETELEWSAFQSHLRNAYCDILFLFDCCNPTSMIDEDKLYLRRCELLCASGVLDKASAMRNGSFTKAIINELSSRKDSKGFDVSYFHSLMTESKTLQKHNLSPTPQFRRYSSSSYQTGIFLESKTVSEKDNIVARHDKDEANSDADHLQELVGMSDARILLKLRLANPAEELLHDEWIKWFSQRPSNVPGMELAILKSLRCHGLFHSDSSLLLLSMPIWVWDNLPADPACEPIGIVRSDNLLPLGTNNSVPDATKAEDLYDSKAREG